MTSWTLNTHPLLAEKVIPHGWTDADGPDFHSDPTSPGHLALVGELAATAGLDNGSWARQVHGGTVLYVEKPGFAGEADALWTDVPGLGVVGRSADCPLVLVAGRNDRNRPVAGFAHASWRSTVQGITGSLVGQMISDGLDPATARAVICPSAGPCCYEVGEEVREAALAKLGNEAEWFFLERVSSMTFNLWTASRAQLEGYGIPADAIAETGVCTICGDGYPSHRRDGDRAGRFAAIVGAGDQKPAGA